MKSKHTESHEESPFRVVEKKKIRATHKANIIDQRE